MISALPMLKRLPHLLLVILFILPVLFSRASFAQTKKFELSSASIEDINAAFDAGSLSSEKLVRLYLSRIEAYDEVGPKLNAVLALNPKAIEKAKALDIERMHIGRRSLLHGIPIVLKDNIDTGDMPTTAGSFMLKGSLPPDDAFIVKRLRAAGAIILAKVNMGEFAIGDMSSLGGHTRNPHNLTRSPGGSSSGTGAAIAAAYAVAGLGTDTGGSVRIPSSYNGIVGLKTTYGLVSRNGVIPLALSLDTVGPMARSVYDVAVMLGVLEGLDPADNSTQKGKGKFKNNYTQFLDKNSLQGARIGVVRSFMGHNREVDSVTEAALNVLRHEGAILVDVTFPDWFLASYKAWTFSIVLKEFCEQIPDYLATLNRLYPKTLEGLIEKSISSIASNKNWATPNHARWSMMQHEHHEGMLIDAYKYQVIYDHAMPMAQGMIEGTMALNKLDAIVYPTMERPAPLIDAGDGYSDKFAVFLANLSGFPDLAVPAGFTSMGMPVSLSFLGRAFSESTLLSLGYAFEQQAQARQLPSTTPVLLGESFSYH